MAGKKHRGVTSPLIPKPSANLARLDGSLVGCDEKAGCLNAMLDQKLSPRCAAQRPAMAN